jgi:hypothetical protein
LRSPAAAAIATFLPAAAVVVVGAGFDHAYDRYAKVIRDHVRMPSVDYSALKKERAALDAAVDAFAQPTNADEHAWTREQRLAFWINAYNAFTLRAIVDHYPIRRPWLTLQPRNSIRQIDGVWTTMRWRAAGREVTLDDIEHQILRRELKEPRIHFAINCASVSCPPLPPEPYRAETLDAQLDEAARRYLASPEGFARRRRHAARLEHPRFGTDRTSWSVSRRSHPMALAIRNARCAASSCGSDRPRPPRSPGRRRLASGF